MKKFVVSKDRERKAKKIEAVLIDFFGEAIKGKKILDIGTGNGEIADYFSRNNKVYSVDVLDQRKNKKLRIIFKKINSEKIPFKDSFFDFVISNHIIEHVPNQNLHLSEIKRVLKKEGVCYLATPNRLFPWECHYKTWFIHYFGARKFHNILKKRGIYKEKLYLFDYFSLRKLLTKYFKVEEYTHKIIKHPKKFGFKVPLINKFPLVFLKQLNFLSQTNVFVLRK